jgi:hypothetical protein
MWTEQTIQVFEPLFSTREEFDWTEGGGILTQALYLLPDGTFAMTTHYTNNDPPFRVDKVWHGYERFQRDFALGYTKYDKLPDEDFILDLGYDRCWCGWEFDYIEEWLKTVQYALDHHLY